MGQQFKELSSKHIDFIGNQKIYFVGTAAENGHVNLSPKGDDSLRVIDANTIVWQNLTGSGNESAAHVLLNPRMTIMFCAFEGSPLILRAYGEARVLHRNDAEWSNYIDFFQKASPPGSSLYSIYHWCSPRAAHRYLTLITKVIEIP